MPERTVTVTVDSVRERLIREGLVGEAVSLAGEDFFARMLTDEEKEKLKGAEICQLMEDLFYAQIRWLFEGPHSLACLGDSIPSRLFRAMVEEVTVSVEMEDGLSSSVTMRGSVPVIEDGRTVAELIESCTLFVVDIGGVYRIHYDAAELR